MNQHSIPAQPRPRTAAATPLLPKPYFSFALPARQADQSTSAWYCRAFNFAFGRARCTMLCASVKLEALPSATMAAHSITFDRP